MLFLESIKEQKNISTLIHQEIKQVNNILAVNSSEMEFNKLVPIVYSQLNRLENQLNNFTFEGLKGKDGLHYLVSKIQLKQTEILDPIKYKTKEEFELSQQIELKKLVTKEALLTLITEVNKTNSVLEALLANSLCEDKQKQALKDIYIHNISISFYKALEKILEVAKKRSKLNSNELFLLDQLVKDYELVKNCKSILLFKKTPIISH